MSKKILIVNQSSGYLTVDVANTFKDHYDEVVVMYGKNRLNERKFHPSIKIQKTIVFDRSSPIKRILSWSICTMHLFFLLLIKYRDYHVLYYTNPPMAYFNALIFKNPFSIVVFDVYPDALKLAGIKDSSLIYQIWSWVNKKVFKKAVQIITLSEGMKMQLSNYINNKKIKVVPLWPGSQNLKPISKLDNPFLHKHGWLDKFIVLYSGNIGLGHKLEVLIEAAELLKKYPNILFLFIGDGAKKNVLLKLKKNKMLENIVFLPWQESSVLPYSLASGDIAVVALETEATHTSVPSKTFNYMAVGAPILGIGPPGSALASLIQEHKMGGYFNGNNSHEITSFIENLYNDQEARIMYSNNSKKAGMLYNYKFSKDYLF